MTFGRWLLIHSFSIFLVVLLVLGYLYREELKLEQVYQQILNLGQSDVAINSFKRDSAAQQQAEQELPEADGSAEKPSQATVGSLSASPVIPEEDTVQATIQPLENAQQDLLFDARQAYWARDYRTAIGNYRRLLAQDPNNPDYNGELGNVYYAMNDYRSASELYFRTAQLLLQRGQRDEAAQLLPPLNAMNRELGDKLKQNLSQR